jgi:intermediate peptidase
MIQSYSYSYLFDRAIAQQMFDKLFKRNPIGRESGELYKNDLLKYGGGRDPWQCVGKLLDNKALVKGDKESMDIVGTWNVDEQPW